jgi:2-polyprenyl-3-methyl-5-hydroxy-6-metoxy-1,4-benzoquinol methylase
MSKSSCNICKKNKFLLVSPHVRDSKKHKIIQCKNCSHIQLTPFPTPEQNKKFYDQDKVLQFLFSEKNLKFYDFDKTSKKKKLHEMKIMKEKSEKDTLIHVNLTAKISKKNSHILEIGSGFGFFLDSMNKSGYNIEGIEISNPRRIYAKRISKVNVYDYDINEKVPEIGKFDNIVMFAVLEYISDPIHFLKNTSKLLKNNGKLLLKIPNVNDLSLKHHESYKNWFWQSAHANYFSPKVLKLVLKKAGFKKIKIFGLQRYSIENMFNWRLNENPQLKKPTFDLPPDYHFIDNYYKKYLEDNLICDTIIATAEV